MDNSLLCLYTSFCMQLEKLWENGGQLNDTVAATLVYTFNPGLIIVHVSLYFVCGTYIPNFRYGCNTNAANIVDTG